MPPAGLANVYLLSLSDLSPAQLPEFSEYMEVHEIEKLAKYRHESDKLRFAASRHLLRLAVSGIHAIAPRLVKIALQDGGKPYLLSPESPLRFSISHSRKIVCLAISKDAEIGADVESVPEEIEIGPLMERIFHENEKRNLESLEGRRKGQEFAGIWTRKEALGKALGFGIYEKLCAFDLSSPCLVESMSRSFSVTTCELGEDSFLSIALEGGCISNCEIHFIPSYMHVPRQK